MMSILSTTITFQHDFAGTYVVRSRIIVVEFSGHTSLAASMGKQVHHMHMHTGILVWKTHAEETCFLPGGDRCLESTRRSAKKTCCSTNISTFDTALSLPEADRSSVHRPGRLPPSCPLFPSYAPPKAFCPPGLRPRRQESSVLPRAPPGKGHLREYT